jgi:hypothetical protein
VPISQYYVDPAINANSGTGTIGDPFGDLQYALTTITRNATDGDQINIKSGAAEVLTASLSLATYGTPDSNGPLVIRGYTSAANDGGIGDISGGGSYRIASVGAYVHFIDLHLHNCGANEILRVGNFCGIVNCEIDTNTGPVFALITGNGCGIAGCYIHNTDHPLSCNNGSCVIGCYNVVRSGSGGRGIHGQTSTIIGNIVVVESTGASGITNMTGGGAVIGNTVVSRVASTGSGLAVGGVPIAVIANNVFQGFSGVGGEGINFESRQMGFYGGNAFYNNTSNTANAGRVYTGINNDALAAAPFVDAANGDFDINGTVAGVTEDAWPSSFLGLAATAPKADKGAVQAGGGSGGVLRRVMRLMGV